MPAVDCNDTTTFKTKASLNPQNQSWLGATPQPQPILREQTNACQQSLAERCWESFRGRRADQLPDEWFIVFSERSDLIGMCVWWEKGNVFRRHHRQASILGENFPLWWAFSRARLRFVAQVSRSGVSFPLKEMSSPPVTVWQWGMMVQLEGEFELWPRDLTLSESLSRAFKAILQFQYNLLW